MDIKIPRGVKDYFGREMLLHEEVVKKIAQNMENYGFSKIKTPIFEDTNLFKRSVGDDTDIVNKEMYTFNDKKGRSLTLRPELTAPVVRSYLENKMYGTLSDFHKFYYYGEAFRYERAQSGRYRQFHQMGVEVFNVASNLMDVEVISLANQIVEMLGLKEYVTLKINTIGSAKERAEYVESLKEYFTPHKDTLCEDCIRRIKTNPLRVLDCKVDSKKEVIQNAPSITSYLNDETISKFEEILSLLKESSVNYVLDETLVRGLDYYNDTVFEFEFKKDDLNFAIIGGGRYDKLISQLSDQNIPAFGFGIGIERITLAMQSVYENILDEYENEIDIYFAPLKEEFQKEALLAMNKLRCAGLKCEMNYLNRNIKQCYKISEKKNAIFIVIIDETTKAVKVKNLATKQEQVVELNEFVEGVLNEDE